MDSDFEACKEWKIKRSIKRLSCAGMMNERHEGIDQTMDVR